MAAGLGFKTFTTGEVLTAADTNGYLMQGVLVFASAAARNAAITSPQEGQFAFTKDTNGLWYYDGAAWVASGATGDIEGVTAGVGISGGGTSGTVTVTNSMATAITTNGDVIYGTGSGTFTRLGIGSSAQVLTVASGVPSWATPAGGGGKVLQVVFGSTATPSTNTTITFADTGITATITPTLNTSKVMILWVADVYHSATTDNAVSYRLVRGATSIQNNNDAGLIWFQSASQGANFQIVNNYLDSPATTSATTYKVQLRNYLSPGSLTVSNTASSTATSTIMLLEIGA